MATRIAFHTPKYNRHGTPRRFCTIAGVAAIGASFGLGDFDVVAAEPVVSGECSLPPAVSMESHGQFDRLLKGFVKDGWVDYACFQTHEAELDRYLQSLATTNPASLSEKEQLALWINAYNAYTIKLILTRYPDLRSIRDIPRRWKIREWSVGGDNYSLDDIEHEILRREFDEPRIHFAIVCASVSCPQLAAEAFEASRLDEQLDTAARRFLADSVRGFRIETAADDRRRSEIRISSIFKWFRKDFERQGSVVDYIRPFLTVENDALLGNRSDNVRVRHLDYDWSLNDYCRNRPRECAQGTGEPHTLFKEDFTSGSDRWREQRLDRRSTEYRVVDIDGEAVLEAVSTNAAAAFIVSIDGRNISRTELRWQWRVMASLTENNAETEKNGDDYAARVFVLFGKGELGPDTRALAYAWAGQQPVGSVFPSPYTSKITTLVLRSGDERAQEWVAERRDVTADYWDAFGEAPPDLAGIAIVVDTDDTSGSATAWFDDIELIVEHRR